MSVVLFTLGGTIAMNGSIPGQPDSPVVARLGGADLVAAVPGLADLGTPLDVRDTRAVPSADLTYAQMLELADVASGAVFQGAQGIVVTQGTDTLEETAYLIDLVWRHDVPIVLTGAMRNPTLAGPDGPANVLAAARVAAAPEARGLGALVVFNDEIHAARWVRKTHSTNPATFASPNSGPIGHVIEGGVRILARPPRHVPIESPAPQRIEQTRVALYGVTLDDDGGLLASVAGSYDGLVVAAFGVGHVPGALAPTLGELAQRLPVVLASRTGSGSVLRNTYGAVGSESDLRKRGLVSAGMLDPYKAKVLLRLALACDLDIACAFEERG
jgi:L-asparaginase